MAAALKGLSEEKLINSSLQVPPVLGVIHTLFLKFADTTASVADPGPGSL